MIHLGLERENTSGEKVHDTRAARLRLNSMIVLKLLLNVLLGLTDATVRATF